MGFFFRKRVRICKGLDLNLSKNGVGISAGVKGLRVSRSAKGDTYLNAGVGGVYYRKKLNKSSKNRDCELDNTTIIICLTIAGLMFFTTIISAFIFSEILGYGTIKTLFYSFVLGFSSPFIAGLLFLLYCLINGIYEFWKYKKSQGKTQDV